MIQKSGSCVAANTQNGKRMKRNHASLNQNSECMQNMKWEIQGAGTQEVRTKKELNLYKRA